MLKQCRKPLVPLRYKMLLPLIFTLLAIQLYPLITSLCVSFENYQITASHKRSFIGFENYAKVLSDPYFWNALSNTLIFVFGALFLEFIFGFILAHLLRHRIRARNFFRSILLTPMFITPIAVGLMFRFMLNSEFGIVPFILGKLGLHVDFFRTGSLALFTIILIDTWQWTPFMTLLLLAGLESLPREPFEAAKVDGASPWVIFRRITFPLMRPIIIAAVIVRMLDAFKVFEYIYVITRGGPGNSTETILYYIYKIGFRFYRVGEAAAMAYILIPIILAVVAAEFYALRRVQGV